MMIEKRSPVKTVLLYIVLILLTFITLLPLLWMVSSSFKLSSEVFSFPIKWIPETWHWENFVTIWQKINLATYTMNSFKLSILITLIQLLTSSFAAYGSMAGIHASAVCNDAENAPHRHASLNHTSPELHSFRSIPSQTVLHHDS